MYVCRILWNDKPSWLCRHHHPPQRTLCTVSRARRVMELCPALKRNKFVFSHFYKTHSRTSVPVQSAECGGEWFKGRMGGRRGEQPLRKSSMLNYVHSNHPGKGNLWKHVRFVLVWFGVLLLSPSPGHLSQVCSVCLLFWLCLPVCFAFLGQCDLKSPVAKVRLETLVNEWGGQYEGVLHTTRRAPNVSKVWFRTTRYSVTFHFSLWVEHWEENKLFANQFESR